MAIRAPDGANNVLFSNAVVLSSQLEIEMINISGIFSSCLIALVIAKVHIIH